jgi:hypothetical protein
MNDDRRITRVIGLALGCVFLIMYSLAAITLQ